MSMLKIEESFLEIIKNQLSALNIKDKEQELFLIQSQMATDENGDKIDISDDYFLDKIMEEGSLKVIEKSEEGFCLDLPYGLCHQNCLWYMESEHYINEDLYTGFALNEAGEWFVHTYLMEGSTIIDPSKEIYNAYFGIKLSEEEVKELKKMFPDYIDLSY